MRIKLSICILFISLTSFAAIPKNSIRTSNSAVLRGAGAIHGGVAAKGFALNAIKSFPGKDGKIERVMIDIGNPLFQAHIGIPGYFHIENSPEKKQVVISFAQTQKSKFDENALKKVFLKSPFVASSEIILDTQSQSTTIVLNLKKQASLRAIPIAGKGTKTAQVNIDLFEDSLLRPTKKLK